jgi:hypothetical protein
MDKVQKYNSFNFSSQFWSLYFVLDLVKNS